MAGVADFIRKKLQQANTKFVAAQQNHPTFARLVSGVNNAGDYANRINTSVANSPVGRFGAGVGLGAIDTTERLAPLVMPAVGIKRIIAGQKLFQPSKFAPAVTAAQPQPTNTAQRIAGQAGQFVGKQLPYMALAEVAGTAAGGAKVLSKLGKLAPAAQSVTRAAVSNAAYSGLTAATDGQSAKDVAKKTALGLATGIPMGAAGLLPNIGPKKIIGAIPRALAGAGANALAAKATGATNMEALGAGALGLLEGPLGQGGDRVAVKRTTAPKAQFLNHEDIQLASKDVSRAGVEAAKKNIVKQVNLGAKGYEEPILVARSPDGGLTVVNSQGKRGDETLQAYKELGMRPPINAPKDVNYLYSGPGKQFNEMDKNNPGTVPKHILDETKSKQLELAQLNEGIAQHPGKNALDEAALQVQTTMENAQAGARYFADGQLVNSSKSSFPDWVPDSLRKKDLFNKVTEHLQNDTVPTKAGRVKELYDIAHEQIVKTAKANPSLDEYHRMLDYKKNLEADISSAREKVGAVGKAQMDIDEAKKLRESAPDNVSPEDSVLNGVKSKQYYDNYIKETQAFIDRKAKQGLTKQTNTEPVPASTAAQEGKIVLAKPDAVSQTANTKVRSLASTMAQGSKSLGKKVPQVSDFYNVDRMAVPNVVKQQVKGEIANAKEQLEAVVGHTLSNREVADLASQTSKVLDKTVTREQTAAKIAANLKLRQGIADAAQKGTVGPDFIEMWIKDKAAGEDIARQLQARSIIAKPEEAKAIDAILEGVYKVNKNAEEVAKAAKGVDFNDPKAAAEFYRSFVKPKAGEWIDLLRYNSMLSSPNTHFNNIFSNYGQTGIIAPIEKTVTGMVDAARAALTGSPRQQFVGEGAAYAKGYYTSLSKATQAFTDSMRGKSLTVNPDIRSIPLALKGPAKAVESVLAVPTKLLEASDQFFTALTSGGVESSLKYRVSKGVAVSDIAGKANEEAAQRLFRGDTNLPQEGHLLKAFDQVTNLVQSARQSDNPIVSTISKFTLPFVKTPMNIFKQSVQYSPLGVTTLWGATNKTEQLSKAILGSSAAAGVATLLGSNRLTWAEPTNSDQKAAYRQAGMQPYSVKIGDKWYSYSKLPPALAFNFALVASVDNAIKEKKLGEGTADVILNSFAKYANFVADQSYVKNIGDFVAGTKGDVYGFAKTLSNYPQQLIPFRALGSWINRLIDPVQRQADPNGSVLDKQIQQIMMQIPGLAQKVPTRNDSAGNPLPSNNRLRNAFSPIKVSDVNPEGEKAFNTLKSISAINQQQKAETDKLKELANQGNVDALLQLTKTQRTALKNSQEEDAIRATLSPVENAVYGLSKIDQEALLAKQPELAPAIAKVNSLKGRSGVGGGVKTSLTSKKLKGITVKSATRKGRKPKTFKVKAMKLGSIKAKKLSFKAPKMKKISLKIRKGKKYGIKRA